MSKITLTDRISVSVRAKTDTESSQQKVDTGKNIAKALGVDDYNDTDAATIGNTSKPTITDENGNEWVSMQDIIDAGKKMHQDGAFVEKKSVTINGNTYTMIGSPMVFSDGSTYLGHRWADDGAPICAQIENSTGTVYGGLTLVNEGTNLNGRIYAVSQNSFRYYPNKYSSAAQAYTYNGKTVYYAAWNTGYMGVPGYHITGPEFYANEPNYVAYCAWAYFYGEQTGGSLIDWTKPDDEIEEDIRQLHETWDVSEHEGAVTANGTYVLAGPIEYNDADPDSHSSGDF